MGYGTRWRSGMMSGMATGETPFFEEDEPIEHIRSILDRPADGTTRQPATRVTNFHHFMASGKTETFAVPVRTLPSSAPARYAASWR